MKKLLCMVLILSLVISSVAVVNADTAINFKDLIKFGKKNWAYDTIIKLANDKVIAGFPDGTYRPDASITREEFVKLLVDALKLEKVNRVSFDDINGIWSQIYIETAVKEGVIIPSEVGTKFRPKEPVTRLDMAYMVGRALKVEPYKVWWPFKYPYFDNKDQLVAKLYSEYLMYGTVKGDNYRYFDGNRDMTRAEAAVVIDRVMQYSQDKTTYKAAKKAEYVNSLVKAAPDVEFEKFMNSEEASKYASTDYFKVENGYIVFKEFSTWDTGDLILNPSTVKDFNKKVYNTVKALVTLARRDNFYVSVWFSPNDSAIVINYSDIHANDGKIVTGSSIHRVTISMHPYDDVIHKNITYMNSIGRLWEFNYTTVSSMEDLAKVNYTMPQYVDGVYSLFKGMYGDVDGKALADYAIKEYRYEYTNPLVQKRVNESSLNINGYTVGNFNDEGFNIQFSTNAKN